MLKLLAFFLLLLALAFGFAQVADTPGHVLLQWGETEYRVSLLIGLAGFLAGFVALMILWSLLRLIFRLPSLIGLANRMRKREKGQLAVARGLVAVGVGDRRQAERHARDSERLLGNEPLALLLKAQTAQLAGDEKGAELAFKAMLDSPDTHGLGLRGLFVEASRRGDGEASRMLAEEAWRSSPDAGWANDAMLRMTAQEGDWRGAIGVVEQGVSRRLIDKAEGRRLRSVLLTAAALESQERQPDEALALAQDALRLAPALVPAAVIVARRLAAQGDTGKAARVLETAWKAGPHPDLAEAHFAARPGDSALDRLKRARTLEKLAPNARESRFILARAAIDAREFAVAREAIEALVLQKATARACLLMAELEDAESGNEGLVRSWLARASRAPRDPAWVAEDSVSDHWKPVSPSGVIGAYRWQEPPQAQDAAIRARIDADRFEVPAPLEIGQEEPAPAAVPPPPPVPPVVNLPATPTPAPEAPRPIEDVVQPFIPDDPGPDPDGPKPEKRFRLFG
ncbi:MAG: heme biosynthesis protein HemY [Methylobacterium sp.]|nr:heme biosynthesis protein HemY [Methylobacterium sp.]